MKQKYHTVAINSRQREHNKTDIHTVAVNHRYMVTVHETKSSDQIMLRVQQI